MKISYKISIKILIFPFAVFLLCIFTYDLTFAKSSTAFPDTVYFEPGQGSTTTANGDTFYIQPGEDVKIGVNLKSDKYIIAFLLPLENKCYGDGDVFLDSAKNNSSPNPKCFEGSRVEYWDGLKIISCSMSPCLLVSASLIEAEPLPPGDGPLCTLTYTALDTGSICLSDIFSHCIFIPDPYPKIFDSQTAYRIEVIERSFHIKVCSYNPGDLNCDKNVDIVDVVFLVNYLFRNGETPFPLKSADANCDEEVTISDAVYLVNYILRDGPAPQTCDY